MSTNENQGTPSPEDRNQRKVRKYSFLSLVMVIVAGTCSVYAYLQQQEAQAQRGEVVRLYREIKRLQEESNAVRLEASKLRMLAEEERRNCEQLLQQAAARKK